MIVLDTNVVSELIRDRPSPRVIDFLREVDLKKTWITAVTAAELRQGYTVLPGGQRRTTLSAIIEGILSANFSGRVLPFDLEASHHYADLSARCRLAGRPIPLLDAFIAAIVIRHDATLATRNVKDFKGCQLSLINPWEEGLPG